MWAAPHFEGSGTQGEGWMGRGGQGRAGGRRASEGVNPESACLAFIFYRWHVECHRCRLAAMVRCIAAAGIAPA